MSFSDYYTMASRQPDLILGIDVGMSCTGVAYANLKKSGAGPATIHTLKSWEYRTTEDKVPTVVVYDKNNVERGPTTWGFGSESEVERGTNRVLGHWFKQRFCPSQSSRIENREGNEVDDGLPPVETLYKDFLSKLYYHIRNEFPRSALLGVPWEIASVEFLFSVPATWDSLTIDRFKGLVIQAGFASHSSHSVTTSLTEPQAVATCTINEERGIFKNGDQLLIVDAGGGTVDLCLVKVNDGENNRIALSEIKPVSGEDAGSTYIDTAFEELALKQLERVGRGRLGASAERVAWEMMMSRDFQNSKHRLGKDLYTEDEVFSVKVPTLSSRTMIEDCKIVNGDMKFEWGQLMKIFDEQVDEITRKIDELLDKMSLARNEQLDSIILSGGLGASAYVLKQLQYRYNPQSERDILKSVKLYASSSPQLCVCRGLVYERVHNLEYGSSTFVKLCSQFSFGVLRAEKYNSSKKSHQEALKEGRVKSLTTGNKLWVNDCVDWFIRKGDPRTKDEVTVNAYRIRFRRNVEKSNLLGRVTIVSSDQENPPDHFTPNNKVRIHTTMNCNYSSLDIQLKREHWYSPKKNYQQVSFEIAATVGAAEVRFECRSAKDGRKLGEDSVISVAARPKPMALPEAVVIG
ncbi:hypothetical protein F4805DRAFT_425177 [Annulohypoxylon moriforme]|nr:hypothetical protein F4805DRAFT_425177 [Annulohypoxylon moriforme]